MIIIYILKSVPVSSLLYLFAVEKIYEFAGPVFLISSHIYTAHYKSNQLTR